VVDVGTHATGGVISSDWLAATLGGCDVTAGGAGACNSAYDDILFVCMHVGHTDIHATHTHANAQTVSNCGAHA